MGTSHRRNTLAGRHDRFGLQSRNVTDQIVILAAGLGSRLGSAEAGVPKPLFEVGGQPLIAHALAHAEACGCQDAVVVIGYEGARVQAAVHTWRGRLTVRCVETPDATAPNGHSLLAAAPHVGSCFYLQMVDHVFGRPVLRRLDQEIGGESERGGLPDVARLLIDRRPAATLDLADATKVTMRGRWITDIGKTLSPWDAIDAGCFRLTRDVFDALRVVPPSEPLTVSAAMRRLAERGELIGIDIDGIPWADVDTPADRTAAERLLASSSVTPR